VGPNLGSIGGSSCTFTPAPGSPSTLTFPGTPANATPGEVATWVFFAKDVGLDSILLIEVSDGVSVPLATMSGSTCVSTFTQLGEISATSVVDSTLAASQMNHGGGSTFLQAHPEPTEMFILIGTSASLGAGPFWDVSYTTCAFTASSGEGSDIMATYYAASGNPLSGPTTGSTGC